VGLGPRNILALMSERVSPSTTSTGPLSGWRLLDLTAVIMGPLATQILADLGAEVIVVENHHGDTNRVMGPAPHPQLSGVALNLLRNKRNISLDIRSEDGRKALLRVAATCDVFITNIRPGALRRARLQYRDLAAVRPDIVYCEAHGFPVGSPREDDPAYDDIIQAETGVADAARRQNGVPVLAPTLIADKVCGLTIAYAVLAALLRRERTGQGEHIEVPMAEVVKAWMLVEHGAGAIPVPPLGLAGYPRILTPNRKPQQTLDGWINVLPYASANFVALFAAGGRHDLIGDARYGSARARIANSDFLYTQVAAIIGTRTTAEWLAFCRQHDIPAAAVASLDDIVAELPVASHPDAGDYHFIPPPVRFSSAPTPLRRHAPLIGADTEEVLAEVGFSAAEVAQLRASGALPGPPPME
jgi:crotonobetainyl-CoA:carnitine CoA-transferase CaiB-like acyl-CoA transferase